MNELKHPIALLVIIIIAAAFAAPFGTPELALFAKDFLPAIATLVAAYAGAYYGATLIKEAAEKEQRSRDIGAGARALFTLWRQLNAIALFQKDIVEKYRDYPPAPLAMPPVSSAVIDDVVKLDIDSIAFLLDHGKSELLGNLCIAESRFIDAIQIIRRRSDLHANEVQPKLEGMIPPNRNLTPDELQKIIGIRLFSLLVDQTQDVINKTDDAVATLEFVAQELYSVLQKIFPEGKFPRASSMEDSTIKFSENIKPSGLL